MLSLAAFENGFQGHWTRSVWAAVPSGQTYDMAAIRFRKGALMPRIPYPDLDEIDDPEVLAILERARRNGTPRPESQAIRSHVPLRRTGNPEDVAAAVLFLSSPMSDYITGQVIRVNGGLYM